MRLFLPPVLLQRLGLRQRGELSLERGHLEVLREQAGEKHQDAAEEDEVGRRVEPKDARRPEHQLRERRHHDEQHGQKHPEDGVDDLERGLLELADDKRQRQEGNYEQEDSQSDVHANHLNHWTKRMDMHVRAM